MSTVKIEDLKKENAILRNQVMEIQERYEYKISELSVLHELGGSIMCFHDFKQLCECILNTIIKNTIAQNCSIMFLDRKKNSMFLVCATNFNNNTYTIEPKNVFSKDDVIYIQDAYDGAAGRALIENRPVLIEDATQSDIFKQSRHTHFIIKSLLSVPLRLNNGTAGVINLSHSDPNIFSQNDVNLFRIISDFVASSLYSALNFEKLKVIEANYRALAEYANNGIAIIQDGFHIYANPKYQELTGYSLIELKQQPFENLIDNSLQTTDLSRILTSFEETSNNKIFNARIVKKNKGIIDVEISAASVMAEGKRTLIFSLVDITDRKILERQLIHAQKMQSMGTLAGGIAHNFNNLLMGIQGNASIALLEMEEDHPHFQHLTNIEKLVKNGSNLTNQLLGYAREGKFEIRPISLNLVIQETAETFGAARKDIKIILDFSTDIFGVKADQGQIEQTLLNLYVNAADAMPEGGTLTIKTANVTEKEMGNKPYNPKPGNYVMVSVKDTGLGIDKRIIDRIFEPFFTTKGLARGTGLGLASAYGIIKGHGGYIDVSSEKGNGTTFNIFLPTIEEAIHDERESEDKLIFGSGTVLLVDDEEMIIYAGEQMLLKLGYNVITANSGKEALDVYNKDWKNIDLVLLDMVMPGMNGGETFDRIKEINNDVKVLLSSGYSLDGHARGIMEHGCSGFIQKPFTLKNLSQKVNEILKN